MLTTILATIVVLGVLIFVHELGHFMTAKWVDIEVPRFSIGFGPRVIGFTRGETEYVISLLPLGGYVKMAGMEEMEHIEGGPVTVNDTIGDAETPEEMAAQPRGPRDFESKTLAQRALVISAGVIMNMLFALLAFTVIAAVWGVAADPGTRLGGVAEELLTPESQPLSLVEPGSRVTAVNGEPVATWREMQLALTRAGAGDASLTFEDAPPISFILPRDDEVKARIIGSLEPALDVPARLGAVMAGGPAAGAGLVEGDRVVRAGDRELSTWQELVAAVERSPGQPVPLVVERDGTRFETSITPRDTTFDGGVRAGRIDVRVPYASLEGLLPRERPGPIGAIGHGATQTWDITTLTVDFLAGMFTGRHSARNVGGPIMIGQLSGQFARAGLMEFLGFMAILSVNLAILNLLPLPVLDGGHLVFLGIEGVRGRPLSINQRMILTQVGFVLLVMLMVWAIGNDIVRAIGL
ncbi:sigma E protease regulator RseP [soil metagenome]